MAHDFGEILEFDLHEIASLDDGRINTALKQALKRAGDDIYDRPGVNSSRTVNLAIKVKPCSGDAGGCDGADVTFEITDSIPVRKSKPYELGVRRGGLLTITSKPQQPLFEDEEDVD